METNPLEIRNLSVSFYTPAGEVEAVRDVSLTLHKGEILVLAGESGSGKSVLCRSVLKLLPRFAKIKAGQICVQGQDITDYGEKKMEQLRGVILSMVFQNPLTTLNPSMSMGAQLREAIQRHEKMSRNQADDRAVELLRLVGIDDGRQRLSLLPQAFSGGQRQRCALAIALAAKPDILFADEPTTALDVTVQAHILDLLKKLRDQMGLSIVFVTHDLGVVARLADRVGIMYAGKIVEIGTAEEIFYDPRHPYTWGLLAAMPSTVQPGERLHTIPGMPPDMLHPPQGDAFAARNQYALDIDYEEMPPFFEVSPTHQVASWLLDPRAPEVHSPINCHGRKGAQWRTISWKQDT